MKRIVSVCSARPNFVKLAAVHHALLTHPEHFEHVVVHTGQHYDPLFSDIFFEQLQIPTPQHNLGIHGGEREEVFERTETAFVQLLPFIKPDVILVYGDVNGAVGPARAADKHAITLGHVEAGLRSFDASMPEEWNRIAMDELADLLFCTEESGVKNLLAEHTDGEIHLVGNTMIDTLVRMLSLMREQTPSIPFGVGDRFAVVTLHRPSNVDTIEALERNIHFLNDVSAACPLIFPVHHRLKAAIEKHGFTDRFNSSIILLPPLGYLPFLRLVDLSAFILTDSGGIQEEATYLQKRCFTLRKNTERPSTILSGSNVLIDIEQETDRRKVLEFAANPQHSSITIPPLWDGKAGERILEVLAGK